MTVRPCDRSLLGSPLGLLADESLELPREAVTVLRDDLPFPRFLLPLLSTADEFPDCVPDHFGAIRPPAPAWATATARGGLAARNAVDAREQVLVY